MVICLNHISKRIYNLHNKRIQVSKIRIEYLTKNYLMSFSKGGVIDIMDMQNSHCRTAYLVSPYTSNDKLNLPTHSNKTGFSIRYNEWSKYTRWGKYMIHYIERLGLLVFSRMSKHDAVIWSIGVSVGDKLNHKFIYTTKFNVDSFNHDIYAFKFNTLFE